MPLQAWLRRLSSWVRKSSSWPQPGWPPSIRPTPDPSGWISGSLRQSVTVPPERPRKANELSVRTNESRAASPPLNTFTDGPNNLQ